jgi:hypothetical protein
MFGGKGFTQIRVKQMRTIPAKVKAPDGCTDLFTPGKVYDVLGLSNPLPHHGYGWGFAVISDNGMYCQTYEHKSEKLNNLSWEITETKEI